MSSFITFLITVIVIAIIIISIFTYLCIKIYKFIFLPFHKPIIDFFKDMKIWKVFYYYTSYIAKIFLKDYGHYGHNRKIKAYQKEFGNNALHHSSGKRFVLMILFAVFSSAIFYMMIHYNMINFSDTSDTSSLTMIANLIIISPVLFIVWFFRDQNRLKDLHNARKNTNLLEFQKLQQWATGNIEGSNDENKIALQISALHSLRNYLKGEFGEDFRRGSFEIFASTLATQHKKILALSRQNKTTIKDEIKKDELTKQINRIIEEEWFNILINHSFSTATISLVGVNLQKTYLRHLDYKKQLDLSFANLQGADLGSANLQRADLGSANLQEADLRFANLRGADLGSANLQGADLRSANLQGADLGSINLRGAYLRFANLQGADLGYGNLQGADLRSVNLQGADLGSANLQGAYSSLYFSSYIERINKQTNQATNLDNLSKEVLSNSDKDNLIKQLTILGIEHNHIKSSIKRLELSTSHIDLEGAIIGSYTKKEADEWVADFKKITK